MYDIDVTKQHTRKWNISNTTNVTKIIVFSQNSKKLQTRYTAEYYAFFGHFNFDYTQGL